MGSKVDFASLIDINQPTLWYAVASMVFNPTFWNIVARAEYKSHILTRLAGGNAYFGCYILAATIFGLGIFRDFLYTQALSHQPHLALLEAPEFKLLAGVLFFSGNTLVLSSMWALGLTGTYLGDYFGILMTERVTGFPFNVTDNPMYYGSTMSFLAAAIWHASPAGIVLSCAVFECYVIALKFEEPFTGMIYAKRDEAERKATAKGRKEL